MRLFAEAARAVSPVMVPCYTSGTMTRPVPRRKVEPAQDRGEGGASLHAAVVEQRRLLAAVASQLDAAGVGDVHRARVATRRLRSLLKTFRPVLDDRRSKPLRADLRRFARSLAAVREADVRRDLMLEVARGGDTVTPGDLERLAHELEASRIEARTALGRQVRDPDWKALVEALVGAGASDSLAVKPGVATATLLAMVADSWKPAVRMLKREPTETSELHALRLSLKHCRYALEPVADIEAPSVERLLRRLRAAQDRIGEHRDTLLAGQWVAAHEQALGESLARRLGRLLERREKRLRRQAAERARRVLPAYEAWRKATRPIRRAAPPGPRPRAPRRRSVAPSAR
jgi:CHAD domain-containing protein